MYIFSQPFRNFIYYKKAYALVKIYIVTAYIPQFYYYVVWNFNVTEDNTQYAYCPYIVEKEKHIGRELYEHSSVGKQIC